MTTCATSTQIRRNESAEPIKAGRLAGQTYAVLSQLGVSMSPSKVARLVHRYQYRVAHTDYPFADRIANSVTLATDQRRVMADELTRVAGYADPTGETAVRNVMTPTGAGCGVSPPTGTAARYQRAAQ